jgi:branched-chain amino acid transport system permease protein
VRRVGSAAVPPGVLLVAAAMLPWLVQPYTLTVLARIMALGLLAASVAVLVGHGGLPSLGQVAPYAVGAYTTAVLAGAGYTTGPWQLLVAVAAAAAFSLLVGAALVRTRAVVFLMVTLAVGQLTAVAAEQWRTVTGGTDGLAGIPAVALWPGGEPLSVVGRYWYVLACTAAALAIVWWLLRSPAGLLLRGVRDNETRMHASGHRVSTVLLVAYTGAGALAGVGGHLLVSTQRYVSPGDIGFQISALVLLAVIIGGTHSLAGAMAGAALVLTVRDWAAATIAGHGPLLLGAVFIAAVYLLPRGLAGLRPDLRGLFRRSRRLAHPPVHRRDAA